MLQSVKIPLQELLILKRVNFPVCIISKRVDSTPASRLLISTLNRTALGLNQRNTAGDQSPGRCGPIHYSPLDSALQPGLHPAHCELAHPTGGQLVHKDAVRYSIKSLTKIQANYSYPLSLNY